MICYTRSIYIYSGCRCQCIIFSTLFIYLLIVGLKCEETSVIAYVYIPNKTPYAATMSMISSNEAQMLLGCFWQQRVFLFHLFIYINISLIHMNIEHRI